MDETLIVLNSLINDEYAKSHNKKKDVAMEIGERMRVLLFRVLDDFMFYHELEPYDQVQFFPFLQQNDDGRDLRYLLLFFIFYLFYFFIIFLLYFIFHLFYYLLFFTIFYFFLFFTTLLFLIFLIFLFFIFYFEMVTNLMGVTNL